MLYVSGEESGAQVRLRAQRLGVEASGVLFVAETSADAVLSVLERTQPGLLIVDSIQTLASDAAPSTAGSVAQVRECAQLLLGWAKSSDAPVFLAGHVTKDGSVAGPRVLEHMVDVVLAMEGEALSSYRVLRCTKNRFGSTNEVVLLEMASDGLAEVADPSAALIGERSGNVPGSAIVATIEGTRPLLCEVQALTSLTGFTPPRRSANGIDAKAISGDVPQKKRLSMLMRFQSGELAVLIGTDVASRGLHIPDVQCVINYDLPQEAEDYVHRIGRTARAGAAGDAISFGCETFVVSLPDIENFIGHKIPVASYDPSNLPDIKRTRPRPRRRPQQRGRPGTRKPHHARKPRPHKST